MTLHVFLGSISKCLGQKMITDIKLYEILCLNIIKKEKFVRINLYFSLVIKMLYRLYYIIYPIDKEYHLQKYLLRIDPIYKEGY